MENRIPSTVIEEVSFKRCAQFVIMQTVFTLITAIILSSNIASPHSLLYLILDILNVFFNVYICLGYIKYAHVVHEGTVSLILNIVIALHILQFVTNIVENGHYLEIKGYENLWYVKSLLMFFGLRLVQSSERDFLSKISRLYLFLFIDSAGIGSAFTKHGSVDREQQIPKSIGELTVKLLGALQKPSLILFMAVAIYRSWQPCTASCLLQFAQGQQIINLDFADACYFSGVTMMTVGYGDIVPLGFARYIAIIEAALGITVYMEYVCYRSRQEVH